MTKYNALIVDSELKSLKLLLAVLEKMNFAIVATVNNAQGALERVRHERIDAVFMEIDLEGSIDGIRCAHQMNMQNHERPIPIIYTTTIDDSQTILEACQTNLYGYLIKPFTTKEVEAAIGVMLKHAFMPCLQSQEYFNLGDGYVFHPKEGSLTYQGRPMNLTKRETQILDLLCRHLNKNVSFERFKQYVWNSGDISTSTVRDTVFRLRKKVPGLCLENRMGIGYCLVATSCKWLD